MATQGQEESPQASAELGPSSDKTTDTTTVSANSTLPAQAQERANLVDLAVKFLSNPRVAGSPMDQKRAFLQKKGD